jgi:hypothetical protein
LLTVGTMKAPTTSTLEMSMSARVKLPMVAAAVDSSAKDTTKPGASHLPLTVGMQNHLCDRWDAPPKNRFVGTQTKPSAYCYSALAQNQYQFGTS